MAGKISEDTLVTSPIAAADDIPIVQGGANKRARVEHLRAVFVTPPQGRLTLTTNVPVLIATTTAQTTIYYTPYIGQFVPIYDGTRFVMTDTGGQLSQATTDNTKSPAAVANSSNYDLFVWSDSGTIRCTRGPAWSGDTSRGTGAGTTELTRINGLLVNNVAITNGPAANRGTYVGTVRSNGSAQIDWQLGASASGGTPGILNVWNMYNRVLVETMVRDSANSWSVTNGTTQAANNSTGNRVSFVCGWQEDSFVASYQVLAGTGVSNTATAGVGIDTVSGFDGRFSTNNIASSFREVGGIATTTAIGFHYMSAVEASYTANSATFYGDNSSAVLQAGLTFRGRF